MDSFFDDHYFVDCRERDRVLEPFVLELTASLKKRFAGLLNLLEFDVTLPRTGQEVTFSNEAYLVAAFLDPEFRDLWVQKFIPFNKQGIVKAKVRRTHVHYILAPGIL